MQKILKFRVTLGPLGFWKYSFDELPSPAKCQDFSRPCPVFESVRRRFVIADRSVRQHLVEVKSVKCLRPVPS